MSQSKAFNTERVLLDEQKEKLIGMKEGRYYNTVTSTADTNVSIPHDLGRVPVGFLVVDQDKAGVFYRGAGAWTDSAIILKCSVATVTAKIFVW